MNIREHIINNFKEDNYDVLRKAIDECVSSKNEIVYPGLGVFLEIIWSNASQELKDELIEIIKQSIKKDY